MPNYSKYTVKNDQIQLPVKSIGPFRISRITIFKDVLNKSVFFSLKICHISKICHPLTICQWKIKEHCELDTVFL